MDVETIIVQAGGKGTRMGELTANKPKALVPIGNRPMLFHLFEKFPNKQFIIIADYRRDVLKKYLDAFADVKYIVVEANGRTGTCSGIREALDFVPKNSPLMLIWSDLVLPENFEFPKIEDDYVGLSKDFVCRYKFENGVFEETPSSEYGVAGLFLFKNKQFLQDVPEEGEFVKWLMQSKKKLSSFDLFKTKEIGLFLEWQKNCRKETDISERCRPFNKLSVEGDVIVKEGIDAQGRALQEREIKWYRFAQQVGFEMIPKIYGFEPLTMERIHGKNVFEYDLTLPQKREVLKRIVDALFRLHSLGECETDYFSIKEAYLNKTFHRLNKIRDLVPFADRKSITVNGKRCPNVFYFKDELSNKISAYRCKKFTLIHGDNTFSNILLDEALQPVLIDPRGYFGYRELFGDPAYDWAKLYYSIFGNYDLFNLKKFKLSVLDDGVQIEIASSGWEELANEYLDMIKDEVDQNTVKLLHAVIWLSLTTYAWEDYDSILGAFYQGLYYLEEVLKGINYDI